MKKNFIVVITIIIGKTIFGNAQFTYFNETYLPPDWEDNNSGGQSNLIVVDSVLWCFGGAFNETSFGNWTLNLHGNDGGMLNEFFIPYPGYMNWLPLNESTIRNSEGNFLGTNWMSNLNDGSQAVYLFELNPNGFFEWEQYNYLMQSDSSFAQSHTLRVRESGEIGVCGIVSYESDDSNNYDDGIFLMNFSIDGSFESNFIYPLYNEQWQDTIEHYSLWLTDMVMLPNDETLIACDWFRSDDGVGRAVPFFLKINSLHEISGHFKFGNEEIDNYYTWMLQTEDDKVLFAYGHGTQWLDLDYPEIDMRIGLFDPLAMDTLWTRSYGHAGGEWQIQDFEKTSDGGFALLGRGTDTGEVKVLLLKVDSEFNEEWFKIYDPPLATYDATLYDLEVTADGGMAAVGNIIATDEAFYRTWLLKLDACGDIVWSGCPFVGIEENKSVSFSISPNPTNHSIQLQSSQIIHDISITDLSGRQVFAQLIMSESKEIDLSELSNGVYLLQATYMDGKTEVVRVVRE